MKVCIHRSREVIIITWFYLLALPRSTYERQLDSELRSFRTDRKNSLCEVIEKRSSTLIFLISTYELSRASVYTILQYDRMMTSEVYSPPHLTSHHGAPLLYAPRNETAHSRTYETAAYDTAFVRLQRLTSYHDAISWTSSDRRW